MYAAGALLAAAAALFSLGCVIVFDSYPAAAAVPSTSYTFETSSGGPTSYGTASCSNNAASKRSGSYGLAVASGSTASNASGCALTSSGSTSAAQSIYITGWAAASTGSLSTQLCVRATVGGTASVSCLPAATVTTTFSQFTGSVALSGAASAVQVYLTGAVSGSAGTTYWDDVTISDTAPASATPTPTPTPTATPTPTPSTTTTPAATPTPSASSSQAPVVGTVTLDATQYGQLFFLLFGFCSLALVLLAVVAGKAMQ